MKNFKCQLFSSFILTFFMVCWSAGTLFGQTMQTIPSDNSDVHQWVNQHFVKGKIPPFSFVYGGKNSNSFIKNWQFSAEKQKSAEPNAEETVYTYSDKKSGLVVKCNVTCFNDFQAVENVISAN